MKKIIVFLFLLCINLFVVTAINVDIIHINNCEDLWVNITGTLPIDDNEYSVYSECSETYKNQYYCDCYDDYNFSLKVADNTINNYTVDITYDYYLTSSSSGSGGNSGRRIKTETIVTTNKDNNTIFSSVNWTKENHKPILINATEEIESEYNLTITEDNDELEVVVTKKSYFWYWFFGIVLLVIIIALIIGALYVI